MRHLVATLTAVAVLSATLPVPAAGASSLRDLSGHWARVQVEKGVADGYIAGYPDGTFRPNQNITRAEFFKLLGAAMRLKPSQAPVGFAETDHWSFVQGHTPAAVQADLLKPDDYGPTFGPDASIKRREIVLAAVRALGKAPLVDEQNPVLNATDAAAYPTWLKGWAAVAMGDGIVTGYEDGSLGLERLATRAEALVMVQRILNKVTMELIPAAGPATATDVRHPGEGEPTWSWTMPADMRPTITNGTDSYTFAEDAWGIQLKPAPGKAVWVGYVARGEGDGTVGVVARLHRGKLTEVARFEGHSADLIAVGDEGQLWFSDGRSQLMKVGADGYVEAVEGVTDRLYKGAIDWNGTLWAADANKLYQVTPEGGAKAVPVALQAGDIITHVAPNGSDTVWLLVESSDPARRAQAIKLVGGLEVQRMNLLTPRSSVEQVAPLSAAGPFVWAAGLKQVSSVESAQEALYKFDLSTGAFTRLVAPRSVTPVEAVAAPDQSGVLLKDSAGKFWRLLP